MMAAGLSKLTFCEHLCRRQPKGNKPDHFWAVQISSPGVKAAIEAVHAALRLHSAVLQETLVDAAAAHVTLAVSHLGSDSRLEAAEEATLGLRHVLRAEGLLEPLPLRVRGLSSFGSRVGPLPPPIGPTSCPKLCELAQSSMMGSGPV